MKLYTILGLDESATEAEIKAAYRKLSKEHHPDKGGDEKKFKEIKQAYEVLFDGERRKRYDETGSFDEDIRDFQKDFISFVGEIMIPIIDNRGRTNFDLMSIVKESIYKLKIHANRTIKAQKIKRELYYDSESKIKRVDDGPNLIADLLKGKIKAIEDHLKRMEAELEAMDRLEAEFEKYKWDYIKTNPSSLLERKEEKVKDVDYSGLKDSVERLRNSLKNKQKEK